MIGLVRYAYQQRFCLMRHDAMTFVLLIMLLLLIACEMLTILHIWDHEQRLREVERKTTIHDTEIVICNRGIKQA